MGEVGGHRETPQRAAVHQRHRRARAVGAGVDFGKTSDDYARFRPGPPPSFYERLATYMPKGSFEHLIAVDVGCGTGLVGIELAKRGARVVGVDPAQNQLDVMMRTAHAEGLLCVSGVCAKAEETGLQEGAFDLWIASQAWHWFEPKAAGAEAARLLKPGGIAVCCNFDYLPGRSAVAKRTEDLILKFTPEWPMSGGTGCHVRPLFDLPTAGLKLVEQVSYEHEQMFTHEGWRGRMRTCNGIGGHHAREVVEQFDGELAEMLKREFPQEPMGVMHRVWLVIAQKA